MVRKLYFQISCGITLILLAILLYSNQFFWDAVATFSRPALFFYEHHLSECLFLSEFNNGDPAIFPFLMAILWKLFGFFPIVAQLMFVPFLLMIVYQVFRLCKWLLPENFIACGILLIFAEPALLSQSSMMGHDLLLIASLLWALNSVLCQKPLQLSIALLLLVFVSRRAMISAFALGIFTFTYYFFIENKNYSLKKKFLYLTPFIPAAIFIIIFIIYRLYIFGWVFGNEHSPWAGTSAIVTFSGLLRNCVIFAFRMLDTGRLFLWSGVLFLLIKFRRKLLSDKKVIVLSLLLCCFMLVYAAMTLPLANAFGARYFIIIYILIAAIFIKICSEYYPEKKVKKIVIIVSILLFSGNFWIYPPHIAQSWDATLAHVPYFSLRSKMIGYIDERKIPASDVGTYFPATAPFKYIDISKDNRTFQTQASHKSQYIFYSNVFNLSDKELREIKEDYRLTKRFSKGSIYVELYKLNIP